MARATAKSGNGAASVVGRSARVRGRVSGDGDLRVEGSIDGDVAIKGELVVAGGGTVAADVQAGSVVVEGAIDGDIAASGSVAIRPGARVAGLIRAASLSIDEGASLAGRIEAEFELPVELTGKAGR